MIGNKLKMHSNSQQNLVGHFPQLPHLNAYSSNPLPEKDEFISETRLNGNVAFVPRLHGERREEKKEKEKVGSKTFYCYFG